MKTSLLAAAFGLTTLISPAATLVFQIGADDNNQAEFEQEADAFNNPQYYMHNGDYTSIIGKAGAGGVWNAGQEILSDGADSAATTDGFPRALVPSRPVIDIFFQLDASAAASPALQFETTLFWLGADSVHDVTFYLNDTPFFTQDGIAGDTPISVLIPQGGPAFNVGSNVLSLVRDGGLETNPWIQIDYVRLTAVPEPSLAALSALAVAGAGLRRRRSR